MKSSVQKTIAALCTLAIGSLLAMAFVVQSFNFNSNQFTAVAPYMNLANGLLITNPAAWTSFTVNSTNANSGFGGSVTATNGFQEPIAFNNIPALVMSAGGSYHTNLAGNATLASFAGVPSGTTWSIYLIATNNSGGNLTLTFPNGCVAAGQGKPPVFTVTNNAWAEFQVNGYGQAVSNVNWSPHF